MKNAKFKHSKYIYNEKCSKKCLKIVNLSLNKYTMISILKKLRKVKKWKIFSSEEVFMNKNDDEIKNAINLDIKNKNSIKNENNLSK